MPCAQMGCVAANLATVAPPLTTAVAVTIARVNVPAAVRHLPHLALVPVLVPLSPRLCLIKCLGIVTTADAKVMDFTHTMPSSMLPELSMALAQPETPTLVKERSLLSWLKPPTRPPVGGQVHQMVHMHGDIALLGKETLQIITVIQISGPALLVDNTTAEDPSNSLTTTTMG